MMSSLTQDLRFAIRSLLRTKSFMAVAVLTLALCTGANTAIFSLLNAVLLRPLPYPAPDRLVALHNSYPGVGVPKAGASATNYRDRREAGDVFEEVGLINYAHFNIGEEQSPQYIRALKVTPSIFRALEQPAYLGRTFEESEAEAGADQFVVLSYGLWRELYQGDAVAIGRDLRLSGKLYQVVGVMPPGFKVTVGNLEWDRGIRLWIPQSLSARNMSDQNLHSNNFIMIARLRAGVSIAEATARVDALDRAANERAPQFRGAIKDFGYHTVIVGLHDEVASEVRSTLLLLQGAALFVLLIGCVNVANLLLVRSNSRLKELAVRFAMGAGRGRVARLLLVESTVLGLLGGLGGLGLAWGGVELIKRFGLELIPRGTEVGIDLPVLGAAFTVALMAGLMFGLIPLAHLLRRDLSDLFRQVSRTGTAQREALTTRAVLVVTQVSLAFVLLVGAGLLIASFRLVLDQDTGFQSARVLTAKVSLPNARYGDAAGVRDFVARALERVNSIPGVSGAAIASALPFGGDRNNSVILIEGRLPREGELPPVPQWNRVSDDYFSVMGIPMLEGRGFGSSDTADSLRVCLIDEFLAKTYWPDRNVIGAKVSTDINADEADIYTVVGVVGDIKHKQLAGDEVPGHIYFSYRQMRPYSIAIAVKTAVEESAIISSLGAAIREVDPALPLYDVKAMETWVNDSLVERRAVLGLSVVFAALALVLAGVGIYGVLAYSVSQRTREIGIRSALGAQSGDIIRMISGHGLKLAGIGLLIGAAGAYGLTRLMASLLFGVEPTDATVFAAVAAALGAVALLASSIPVLRAVRVEPMTALRHE